MQFTLNLSTGPHIIETNPKIKVRFRKWVERAPKPIWFCKSEIWMFVEVVDFLFTKITFLLRKKNNWVLLCSFYSLFANLSCKGVKVKLHAKKCSWEQLMAIPTLVCCINHKERGNYLGDTIILYIIRKSFS